MKTHLARTELMRVFGFFTWPGFRAYLKDARAPYPVTVDWRCMAVGRRKEGEHCAFGERIGRIPGVNKSMVTDFFTYIRFDGSDIIYRYKNPPDMVHQIKYFDECGMFDDMEEGDEFVLEPPGKARSHEYATHRRRSIKAGSWSVTPRGPNPNMRREPKHHFRPY